MPKDGNAPIVEHQGRAGGIATYKLPESLAELCIVLQKKHWPATSQALPK